MTTRKPQYLHDCPVCKKAVYSKPHTGGVGRQCLTCSRSCGAKWRNMQKSTRTKGFRCAKCGGLNEKIACLLCDRQERQELKKQILREVENGKVHCGLDR